MEVVELRLRGSEGISPLPSPPHSSDFLVGGGTEAEMPTPEGACWQ